MRSDRHDDAELVAAVARGDETAERLFDQRFRSWIDGIARKVGVPEADRPDVVQEALFEAVRQLRRGAFQHRSALASWVYRIAFGKAVDYRRRQPQALFVALEDVASDNNALITANSVDQVLAVEQALALLPAEEQVVLLASEREQLTLKELGQMLGESTSTVWDRLQRARSHFRRALESGNPPGRNRLKD